MNQLNSKPPMFTRKAFFALMYWMVEDTLSGLSAVLMALTMTVAAAVPSMFMAVPTMVWSALKLIAATARSRENAVPASTLASTTSTIMRNELVSALRYFIISAPPRAPMTMMPSRPMLITPLCSAKQPPKATRISTDAKIRVYWISNSITCRPLPARPSWPVFCHAPCPQSGPYSS